MTLADPSASRERDSILACLDVIREIHADLSLADINVLLLVAARPGISRSELARQMNISIDAASRSLRALASSDDDNPRPPALGLIQTLKGSDARTRRSYLTVEGAEVVERLNGFVAKAVRI